MKYGDYAIEDYTREDLIDIISDLKSNIESLSKENKFLHDFIAKHQLAINKSIEEGRNK